MNHEVHSQTLETLVSAPATPALTMLPYWSVDLLVTRPEAESINLLHVSL